MGVYQVSCGPIPMNIGGNRSGAFADLPIHSKSKDFRRKTNFTAINSFKHVCPCFILKVGRFVKVPGYEPIHLDMEKLFLLSVSKENLDVRGRNEKNIHYIISKNSFFYFCVFS